ncbi:MAG: cobalamin biosynthesis protein [Desulfovibrionaceae bacterium]|nr:cobalamin biosynthesis protein [Desulfovibrionaceae bacterium]
MGWFELFLPLAALALDLIFKDFRSFPHPVQGVAWLADRLEPRARRFESRGLVCLPGIAELQAGFLSGGACLAVILIVTGGAVFILGELPFVGIILTVYFAYAGLALGGLLREGRIALGAVMQGEISEARQAVSMLVSRDLSQADRPVLLKTLAETLSENFNDALIAPFFWLLTGGPVGLWMYKAVSTMDSLWGYRTEKWRYLGFAAARFDDLLAFIPARLSSWLLCFFSRFVPHFGRWPGYARVKADALKMESPNAGWGMAAAAWLHHGQMGGRAVYFGEVKEKPLLGPGNDDKSSGFEWNEEKIRNLLRHIKIAGIGGCILMWGVWCLFRLIFSG